MSNLTDLLQGLWDLTHGKETTTGAILWKSYDEERERLFGAEQRAKVDALANKDDLELSRSLASYIHSAREAMRFQDHDGWTTFMDLAQEYSVELSRRIEESTDYIQKRSYVYRCGCVRSESIVVPSRQDAGEVTFQQSGRCIDCLRKDHAARRTARRGLWARLAIDSERGSC